MYISEYDELSYIVVLQVVYKSDPQFARDCKESHDDKIRRNNASFIKEIYDICNNDLISAGSVVITKTETSTVGFDLRTSFTIKLPSTDYNQTRQKPTCVALLANGLGRNDFLDYTGFVQCQSGTTTIFRKTPDGSNKVISSGYQCENGIMKMTIDDVISKCIACPPGTYSGSANACDSCPHGRFQSNFGQDECLDCPSDNLVPSEDTTSCLAVCPPGFISVDGLPTCMPCPENHYWVNRTYCEPCPNNCKTLWKNAITDISGCKDKTVHELICPRNKTVYINTAAGEFFNIGDFVSVTPSDSEINFTFSPAVIIFLDHTSMAEQKKMVVTATDKWGAEDQCSFYVETKAGACFRESFPVSVPNALPVTCTTSNISCTVTCNSGFVFFDGNITKKYHCTGQNIWLPALPSIACIEYDEPPYNIVLQVVYKSNPQFAKDCVSGHDDKIKTNNASLTNDIYNICNIANFVSAGPVVITHTQTTTTGFDLRTMFTIHLLSTNPDEIRQNTVCRALLETQIYRTDFLDYTGIVQCNSGTTTVVRQTSDSQNQVIISGNQCNGITKMTTVDSVPKCIPCPPGTYFGNGDQCSVCPDGKFQSNIGQDECLDCPSDNPVPSEDKTTCTARCRAGFFSVDGLPTCFPCPENHYWVNKNYCEPCPKSHSTAGKNAITSINGCKEINCMNNIDDCVGMYTNCSLDPTTNRCSDVLNDYQCKCKAGYTGKNCTEKISECLQQHPCEHGGTCTDKVADFGCSCMEGWTGKRCEIPKEYCSSSPCLNRGVCFNLTGGFFCRCPSGTTGVTCGTSPEVCSIVNPCTTKGTCEDKDGTAQCNCYDDYYGTSCQLMKDHCADLNTCKHDGKCVTRPVGFQCECGNSYSGSTCSLYTDPCSSNPCHSTAKCISNKEKYMCYCEHGNLLTDYGCKDIDENFDIFMNRYKTGMPAYLRNPFVSNANHSMTIIFWIRILARPGENPVLVSLEKIPIGTIIPTFNTSHQQFIVRGQSAILRSSTETDYIQYGTDVADGKWHFMVFSLEPSGKVKLFIDSIKTTEYDRKSVTFNVNEYESWQVIFGSTDTLGRISKLRIYKTVFHDIDIYKAKDKTSHLPSDQLIQGWTNIKLTWSTFKKVPSGAGNDNVCDINFPNCLDEDRTKPSISCPDDQIKVGTERLTAFTGLKNKYIKLEDVKYVNTSVHDDELYTYGSSNEVFIGYDEALNYGICRFKVYVKYADCPIPETDADVSYCPNSKHICKLNCPSGEALSRKHKLRYRCGALGVYNLEHPRKKFILPTCGGQQNQTIALSVRLTYKTVTNCVPTFSSNIKTGLDVKLKTDLPNLWPMGAGMTWCGSQCIWDAICRGTSTYIDVTFTLHVPKLSASIDRNGKTYQIREALFMFILQENGLNFNNVAGAQLERDSVTIDESSSCPAGYVVVSEKCVECGKGTYRNDTTMTCEFCAIGSYQTNVGRTVCELCESSKTTLNFGSYSSTDCIGSVPNNSDSGEISADMVNTGLIIGLSIGLVLLLCIVISIVIVYKRLTTDSDYSVPVDKNRNQVQSHEHHYDEMNNRGQQYLNVGSIPHNHGESNNGYETVDDNYATITEILSVDSSSNNDYFELFEKPTETDNI